MTFAFSPIVANNDLRKWIGEIADAWDAIGAPSIVERFVLRNGQTFPAMSKRLCRKRRDKQCFKNAAEYVLRHGGRYVEGFAVRPEVEIPVHHAWVDVDGKAMDPTWRDFADCIYFGVPFETTLLVEELFRTRVYGLLLRLDPGVRAAGKRLDDRTALAAGSIK